jgi:uncharacterized protein YegP (UPF0339 family)
MDAPFFLHLDRDYCWRWYVTDADGKMVAVTGPYFARSEAEDAMRVCAMPMAA